MAEKKGIKTKKHTKVKKGINASKRSIQKNNDRIKELELQLNELQDKQLRLKAEFENFRKRKQREISELFQYDGERVIKGMLPLIDDLERMAKAAAEEQNDEAEASLFKGAQMVESKIKKFLGLHEIIPFGEEGESLDSELHDAMLTETNEEMDDNIILNVFEKGYRYRGKVIRHARVIVNKK
ncbi:MAG: nucleotide exchange factor GrpE [Candidatus Neomarinimicrobiota bacterium]|nr:nucleotide exchange factor GrpE [Candidatus Neomarinimicrobiota bacterium]